LLASPHVLASVEHSISTQIAAQNIQHERYLTANASYAC